MRGKLCFSRHAHFAHHRRSLGLAVVGSSTHNRLISTLTEIESAAALPAQQKQELILFLVTWLRADGAQALPLRRFTKEQMAGWISEDESDMERLRRGA